MRLHGFDFGPEPEGLSPQLDGLVEIRHLHGKPVLSGRSRKFCAVDLQRLAQLCFAAVGAGAEIAASRQFTRHVVASGFQGARQFRERGPCHEAVAHDDAGSASTLGAAIQRGKSRLESGDGTPAIVLQVQQSEALGFVICDSLQQRVHL